MYKTYIRPILYNGMSVLNMNLNQLNEFKRIEGNIVKTIVYLHKSLSTTEETLDTNKFNLFFRLQQNEATKELLNYSNENRINDSFFLHKSLNQRREPTMVTPYVK